MKKNGFTLAESLITLGLIGVVMALMMPNLIQNTGTSRVGPALRRAKTDFEEATSMMLSRREVDTLDALGNDFITGNDGLQRFLKGARKTPYAIGGFREEDDGIGAPGHRYDTEYGVTYMINTHATCSGDNIIGDFPDIPNNQLVGEVYIDINGGREPNRLARDVFMFYLYNDGTIRPNGINNANRCSNFGVNETWRGGNCDETGVAEPTTCAGSIFEHRYRMIYN